MKKSIAKFLESHFLGLTQAYVSFIAAIIFLSGIGRYRAILFLFIYFLIYSVFLSNSCNTRLLKKIYAPILVIAIYFDINTGPVLPILPFNNILLAFVCYFSLKWLLDAFYKKGIESLTSQNIFTCCPNCKHETNEFTDKCDKCGYSSIALKGSEFSISANKGYEFPIEKEEATMEKVSLGFSSDASIYKNGSMLDFSELVITDKRIILISKKFFQRGISNKTDFLLSVITNVHIEERKHHGLKMNIIVFTANGDTYELFQIHKRLSYELAETVKLLTCN